MDKFGVVDTVYSKINLMHDWSSCTYTLNSNVIEIEDKDGCKFLLTIEDVN